MIADGRLPAGQRLPAERELAKQFGVSRTVIREAAAALAARGLLEVQAGGGAVVRAPSSRAVSQTMAYYLRGGAAVDYNRVHEVRRVLEVEIAGLAAERRTEEDLHRLEGILHDARAGLEDRDGFARYDVAFHAALARAAHNDLFVLLLESLSDVMMQVRFLGFETPGAPGRALKHHRAVLEQVRNGDAEGAREAMRDHLAEAEDTQRRALELVARGTEPS
jgi:GntR family transcriptional repressor for pyruvate dehydrogenase complex